jgi:thiamine-phosphate pyrophosphorylase
VRPIPRLHLIGPLDLPADAYPAVAAAAARGGVEAVHVRLPGADADELLALALAVAPASGTALLVVNGRAEVAARTSAMALQLPSGGESVAHARDVVGAAALIGRSVHDVTEAAFAVDEGADWLLAGHVFATPSHPAEPGRGLAYLTGICRRFDRPVIAIGGITVERIPAVLAAGAHGVALGRELLHAPDPEATARAARSAIVSFQSFQSLQRSRGTHADAH